MAGEICLLLPPPYFAYCGQWRLPAGTTVCSIASVVVCAAEHKENIVSVHVYLLLVAPALGCVNLLFGWWEGGGRGGGL